MRCGERKNEERERVGSEWGEGSEWGVSDKTIYCNMQTNFLGWIVCKGFF